MKATALAPDNLEYRNTLATYYSSQAATAAQQAQTLQLQAYQQSQGQSSAQPFDGVPGSTLGTALQGAVSQAQSQTINSQSAQLQARYQVFATQAQDAYSNALAQYKVVTNKQPKDPSGWYNYGLTARQAGQNATAIAAFKQFLKIAPDAPESPGVKAVIKQLAAGQDLGRVEHHRRPRGERRRRAPRLRRSARPRRRLRSATTPSPSSTRPCASWRRTAWSASRST